MRQRSEGKVTDPDANGRDYESQKDPKRKYHKKTQRLVRVAIDEVSIEVFGAAVGDD